MKKGFTLIELLSIILILGVIALIAIPTITNIVSQTRKYSFKATVDNIVKAVENNCQKEQLKREDITKKYFFNESDVFEKLDLKGNKITNGNIELNDSCEITYLKLSNDLYTATLKNSQIVINEKNSETSKIYADGTAVFFDPINGVTCNKYSEANSAQGVKEGCLKWYIFNDDEDNDTVDMLLDHNLNSASFWNKNSTNYAGPTFLLTDLYTLTDFWTGIDVRTDSYELRSGLVSYKVDYNGHRARIISANEVAHIVGADKENTIKWNSNKTFVTDVTNINLEISEFYFDGGFNENINSYSSVNGWKKQYANITIKSKYPWLYDNMYKCQEYGCENIYSTPYSYWTIDAVVGESTKAWRVIFSGKLTTSGIVSEAFASGIRPVITIPKSKIF